MEDGEDETKKKEKAEKKKKKKKDGVETAGGKSTSGAISKVRFLLFLEQVKIRSVLGSRYRMMKTLFFGGLKNS